MKDGCKKTKYNVVFREKKDKKKKETSAGLAREMSKFAQTDCSLGGGKSGGRNSREKRKEGLEQFGGQFLFLLLLLGRKGKGLAIA